MKDRTRVVIAVAAGYYLGRRHKLRLAAALAAAGLASRMKRGEGGGLLQQGTRLLGSSPELQSLTDRLRGELVEVGKAAAVAATSRQIDTLTSRLHDRAESLRKPGGATKADEEEAEEVEEYEGDEYDEEPYEEEEEEKPPPRKAPAKPKGQRPVRSVTKARR